jgi:hypothetical protein
MDYIDTYKPKGLQGKWSVPPRPLQVPEEIPPNLDNNQFVEWLFNSVIHEPESAFGYEATKLVRDLNIGAVVEHGIVEPINRENIFNQFKSRAQNQVVVDKLRVGELSLQSEKFIEVANNGKKD